MKKNLFESFLDWWFPHRCYFCGKISDIACEDCLKSCQNRLEKVIHNNQSLIEREFYVSDREGVLEIIVDDMKFKLRKDNYRLLAELLARGFMELPDFCQSSKLAVVPIPTSEKHARCRGFRHVELIASRFCKNTGIEYAPILVKTTNSTQRGASAKDRQIQARSAYKVISQPRDDKIYLLVDDIKTTGATLEAAARALKRHGAVKVWAIYLMRQKI